MSPKQLNFKNFHGPLRFPCVVGTLNRGTEKSGMSADHWPAGSTPLVAGVQPPGFTPVTEEVLGEMVRRIVTALCPEKIILFGSYAYGKPSNDSDVDVLVILETSARPVDRYLAVSRLLRPRPFPLDILVRTPDEIRQALQQGDTFIRDILRQGRVLYEHSD